MNFQDRGPEEAQYKVCQCFNRGGIHWVRINTPLTLAVFL